MSTTPFTQISPEQVNGADTAAWKEILRQYLYDLRVAIPAIVQSFDSVTQTVTVAPTIKESLKTPQGIQVTECPPIAMVPVAFPSGGGFSCTFPIQPGDEGLLVFADMCIDLWWTRGGVQGQFEDRRHDYTDCEFIPGGRSKPRALSAYSPNTAQLRSDDGMTYVEIAPGGIVNIVAPNGVNITGNLNVTGDIMTSLDGTIDGVDIKTHVHSGVTAGGDDSGPPV